MLAPAPQPTPEAETPGAQAWAAFFAEIRRLSTELDVLDAQREQERQQEAARQAEGEDEAA